MENYKEKYEQALSQAKKELKCCGSLDYDAARQIFRLFPELKESEDERIRKSIIRLIQRGGYMSPEDKDKAYAWLEKHEPSWSEEDERMFTKIEEAIKSYYAPFSKEAEEMLNWFKPIKDRYTWKPSDKQIEAVRIAAEIGTANNSWAMGVLKSMYQDLKKLKGE